MQFCQTHWDSLREAIEQRGLGSLISETPETAMAAAYASIEGKPSVDTFCPLMNAMWSIASNAMKLCGNPQVIMMDNFDGTSRCPLCFINSDNPWGYNFDWWIEFAAQAQVDKWKGFSA